MKRLDNIKYRVMGMRIVMFIIFPLLFISFGCINGSSKRSLARIDKCTELINEELKTVIKDKKRILETLDSIRAYCQDIHKRIDAMQEEEQTIISSAPFDTMKLYSKLDSIHMDLFRMKEGLTRYVLGEVFFAFERDCLTDTSELYIRNVVDRLKPLDDKKILLIGYTDSTSVDAKNKKYGYKNNYELSLRRAEAVARFMQNSLQVDCMKIYVQGGGKYYPFVENKTIEDKQRNRCVEILLVSDEEICLRKNMAEKSCYLKKN